MPGFRGFEIFLGGFCCCLWVDGVLFVCFGLGVLFFFLISKLLDSQWKINWFVLPGGGRAVRVTRLLSLIMLLRSRAKSILCPL